MMVWSDEILMEFPHQQFGFRMSQCLPKVKESWYPQLYTDDAGAEIEGIVDILCVLPNKYWKLSCTTLVSCYPIRALMPKEFL